MSDVKEYLVVGDNLIHKPNGWTEKEANEAMDKVLAIFEGYGDDVQCALSWSRMTEEQLVDRTEWKNIEKTGIDTRDKEITGM